MNSLKDQELILNEFDNFEQYYLFLTSGLLSEYPDERKNALDNIDDQNILAFVALNDVNANVRLVATKRINDEKDIDRDSKKWF